jgi:hypothetical protein
VYDTKFKVLIQYQKTDKYKQKYWENIFVGKLPINFTDKNVPSVFTEGITVGKTIIKTKQKKWWSAIFTNGITDEIYFVSKFVGKLWTLFIMSITKGITNKKFCQIESRWYYLAVFWKILIKLKFEIKYYRRNHRWIEKSSVIFDGLWKFFIKLNITDGITNRMVKNINI